VLMAAASHLGGILVSLQRRAHLAWKLAVYREIRDGGFEVVEDLHRRALRTAAARGAALSLTWAVIVALIWSPLTGVVPAFAQEVLGLVPILVVPLAVGSLSDRFGHRRAVPMVTAWALITLAVWRFAL